MVILLDKVGCYCSKPASGYYQAASDPIMSSHPCICFSFEFDNNSIETDTDSPRIVITQRSCCQSHTITETERQLSTSSLAMRLQWRSLSAGWMLSSV